MGKSDGTSCTDLAHQLLSATFPALFATLACRPLPRSRGNTSRASGTIAAPTPSSLLPRTDCAPLHRLWPAHLMNQSLAKKSIEEKLVGTVVSVSGGRSSAGQGGDRPAVHGIWDQRRERRGGRAREERARRRRQRDASTGPRPPAGECIHSTAAVCHALAATPLQPAITTTLPPPPCCLLPQPLTLIHIRLRQVSAHAARLGQQSRQDADCSGSGGAAQQARQRIGRLLWLQEQAQAYNRSAHSPSRHAACKLTSTHASVPDDSQTDRQPDNQTAGSTPPPAWPPTCCDVYAPRRLCRHHHGVAGGALHGNEVLQQLPGNCQVRRVVQAPPPLGPRRRRGRRLIHAGGGSGDGGTPRPREEAPPPPRAPPRVVVIIIVVIVVAIFTLWRWWRRRRRREVLAPDQDPVNQVYRFQRLPHIQHCRQRDGAREREGE